MEEQRISLKAFTLIEIVMVIVILGVLALLAAPRFADFYFIKLRSAAVKVVSDIRYTQQYALANHDDYKIIFNTTNNTYDCQLVSDSSYIKDPFTQGNLSVNFNTDVQYKGIKINSATFGSGSTLRFNWQGIPQDSTGAALTSAGTVNLTYQSRSITISVGPQTGLVTMQ